MKAAVVTELGKPPTYEDFRDPQAQTGQAVVSVTASALSHLTLARAAGNHYSSKASVPFVPGVDGVGFLPDGQRVYFILPDAPFGALGEKTLVEPQRCIPIPGNVDDVTAAAIANPGMSSWPALTLRAHMKPGETVLVNGATGGAGKLAIQIAKYLGAKRVIATGRDSTTLESTRTLGADETILLSGPEETIKASLGEEFRKGVDIVLDYLFGASAEAIIRSVAMGNPESPVRFVQLGALSGAEISLQGSSLRSSGLVLLGSGLGAVSTTALLQSIESVFQAVVPGNLKVATRTAPLAEIGSVWSDTNSSSRIVLQPHSRS